MTVPTMNLMVASTKKHAAAMIKWLQYPTSGWVPAAYGDVLTDRFWMAQIVAPVEKIQEWQVDWILETLVPAVQEGIVPIPHDWKLQREDTGAPQLAENRALQ